MGKYCKRSKVAAILIFFFCAANFFRNGKFSFAYQSLRKDEQGTGLRLFICAQQGQRIPGCVQREAGRRTYFQPPAKAEKRIHTSGNGSGVFLFSGLMKCFWDGFR